MIRRQPRLAACSALWTAVVLVAAAQAVSHYQPDARVLVGVVAALTAIAALEASRLLMLGGHRRRAGVLLVASAAAPTGFAWVLNLAALLLGVFLLLDGPRPAWARVRQPKR